MLFALAVVSAACSQAGEPLFGFGSPDRDAAEFGPPPICLLSDFRKGPMADVEEIVFAVRKPAGDPHWYANFGTTLEGSGWSTYEPGGRLYRLNLRTGDLTVLLADSEGAVRDPVVDYDGRTILFSYRKGSSPHYHLYEIGVDGSGLRQLTDGPFDDIEPIDLPDGGLMFVSTRCKRRVNCHTTETAVLYRCDADGGSLRPLSSNNQPDNTPWVLPNGQVLYTRWEYVDRSQVSFHHLWTTTPDGFRQMVFYGNQHPGITMIGAKPIPGSPSVVASFSPGHGRRDHEGVITVVDLRRGPDHPGSVRPISHGADYRDPWAFSETAFLAARRAEIVLLDGEGREQTVYTLPPNDVQANYECYEPRPVVPRQREPLVAPGTDWSRETGRLVLADVYRGRNMAGVERGEIRKLLVLETLPKPMQYTGGMEPLSYGGTFTLHRIVGTIPVEPDGSAYAELPALRSLFFVALDENDLSVKRMQSFLTVMPGETTGCVGCHEQRVVTPEFRTGELMALQRAPSRIEPIPDVPDVLDFPRDVQPILDRRCLPCHDEGVREGGVSLSGDRGPMFSISYYTLTARDLISDGRNALGNRPPRSIGSSASRLLPLGDGSHHEARFTDHERAVVRLWIDSGAVYPGTYAALGTGMIGGFEIIDRSIRLDRSDVEWPAVRASMAAIQRRCAGCHGQDRPLPLSASHIAGPGGWGTAFTGTPPWEPLTPDDVRRRWSRHLLYNLSRPHKSTLLLAPLHKQVGGLQACGETVFAGTDNPDYRIILQAIEQTAQKLDEIKRFDMPGFQPRREYVAELQRFGILPADLPEDAPIDGYAKDRAYWESLWHRGTTSDR